MIRILLVDDHEMIVDSLRLLFNLMEGIEVVNTETDSRNVINILENDDIDIVITDFRMPHINGLQLTGMIKTAYPEIKIIILSVNEDSKDIQDAYHAGASGYIMKKAGRKDLEDAVQSVAAGKLYFGQDAMHSLLSNRENNSINNPEYQLKLSGLTKREVEIVKLLSDELSSVEIGKELNISTGTVESHRHNILRKLNVRSTVGVIKFAIKAGLIK